MPKNKKRTYNSSSRAAQAEKTRERVLAAAQKLFAQKGFNAVTVQSIALKADVSVPTVYGLFKSKVGVLRAITDEALSHDDFEELVERAVTAETPEKFLVASARIARKMYDAEHKQKGSLQSLGVLDGELKKLEKEREERRYKRQEKSFKEIIKKTALVRGIDMTQARDILWAFTGRDMYRLLVVERGWSSDDYEAWLAKSLERVLLRK